MNDETKQIYRPDEKTLTMTMPWLGAAGFVALVAVLIAFFFGTDPQSALLAQSTAHSADVAERIKPVGEVKVASADTDGDQGGDAVHAKVDLAAGEELYKGTCFGCHDNGTAGAPKFGDAADWAPRIEEGMDAIMHIAINGQGAMPPRGGSSASDAEVRDAVLYMLKAADADFAEKQIAAADQDAEGGGADDAADAKDSDGKESDAKVDAADADEPADDTETQADAAADDASGAGDSGAAAGAAGAGAVDLAAGKTLYDASCAACHAAGVAGAPKLGSADDWKPRIDEGMDALMDVAINGRGAMPPRGASTASDEELRDAVLYMVNEVDPDFVEAQK